MGEFILVPILLLKLSIKSRLNCIFFSLTLLIILVQSFLYFTNMTRRKPISWCFLKYSISFFSLFTYNHEQEKEKTSKTSLQLSNLMVTIATQFPVHKQPTRTPYCIKLIIKFSDFPNLLASPSSLILSTSNSLIKFLSFLQPTTQ